MNTFSAAQRSRVTMLDVAERAGVSKASVSDGTRSRIERVGSFKAQIERRPALQGAVSKPALISPDT